MHFKLIFPIAATSLFTSCNNQQRETAVDKPEVKKNILNCYRYINNRDTVILKTISAKNFITGTLVYNLYQKDKNMGTIEGQMKGEVLIANYTFESEGVQSVRAVAFKKFGETFIEGHGETENINGKDIFKDLDALNFTSSIVLTQFNCEK